MRLLTALIISLALFAGSAMAAVDLRQDAEDLLGALLTQPLTGETDYNHDGKTDVADLVLALQASESNYVRPDIRNEAMSEAQAYFSSLVSEEMSVKYDMLISWLEAHPAFDEVGLSSDEAVWATFNDGLPILFIDNRPRGELVAPVANPAAAPVPWQMMSPPSSPGEFTQDIFSGVLYDSELPYNRKVEIINAFGDGWDAQTTAIDLENDFQRHGYAFGIVTLDRSITTTGVASRSVVDMKNLRNVDVLYLGGHGGTGRFDNAPHIDGVTGSYFSVTTGHRYSSPELTSLRAEYEAKEIVPVVCSHSYNSIDLPFITTYWSITENFIENYVTFGSQEDDNFGENALVVVDACSSSNSRFRQACEDKGAAVYLGWQVSVGDGGAALAMDHFFGRLLGDDTRTGGANKNVRPFDIDTVFQEMGRLGLINIGGSTLEIFRHFDTELAILRPMLHNVQVYPSVQRLYVFGIFGENPEELTGGPRFPVVTVDGHPLNVTDWRRNVIECDIPPTGEGSVGDVVVTIDGLSSTPIPLSEYIGSASITQRLDNGQGGYMNIATANFDFRTRQGMLPYRLLPDMDPVWPWVNMRDIDQDHPEALKLTLRHQEEFYDSDRSHFEAGDQLHYTYGGRINLSGCDGSVSGSDTISSFAADSFTQAPNENIFYGTIFFSTEEGSEDVTWNMQVDMHETWGVFVPDGNQPGCVGPSQIDFLGYYENFGQEVLVDKETLAVPPGSYTTDKYLDEYTLQWDSLVPCCDLLTGYRN